MGKTARRDRVVAGMDGNGTGKAWRKAALSAAFRGSAGLLRIKEVFQ